MTPKIVLIITLISFCLNLHIYAQDTANSIITEQVWLDYNASYKINEKLDIYGDIGPEQFIHMRGIDLLSDLQYAINYPNEIFRIYFMLQSYMGV